MNAPCMKCQKREVGCHAICDAYIRFQIKVKRIRQKREESNNTFRTHNTKELFKPTLSTAKLPK